MKVRNNKQKLIILLIIIGTTFTYFISKDLINKNKTYKNTIIKETIKTNKNVIAAYIKQDNGTYKEVESIPQEGYQLNTSKSTCSNGAIPGWDVKNKRFYADNLTTSGTSCYLYFDKIEGITIDDIIATLNAKTETPNFANTATTDEGVYAVGDGMYGGTSYYWRGAVTNNYVKFANFCWRIIRINGDKTIRLIYDGTTCHQNGESTTDSIAVASAAYNTLTNQSNYVGWTYEGQLQRPANNLTATSSNAKIQLDSWYNSNIIGTNAEKVAQGKYCNDRNTQSGYTWSINGSAFYSAARGRLDSAKTPTLSCSSGDVYTLSIGLITADETSFVGEVDGKVNSSYYLYNGQDYWTMSPYYWNGNNVRMFYVATSGNLDNAGVTNATLGLRPVINLRSDIIFSDGDGTLNNPYIVAD